MAGRKLVDVRSPEEFRGERLHMPDYPNEGALRGGHIPGARNVPWARAVDPETHCFRTADELRAHCSERLAAYKVPKTFELAKRLPRTASGKLLRRELT